MPKNIINAQACWHYEAMRNFMKPIELPIFGAQAAVVQNMFRNCVQACPGVFRMCSNSAECVRTPRALCDHT